jgi:hypothetical protein
MDLKRIESTDEECECTKMVLSQTTYIKDMKLFELSNKIPMIPMNNAVYLPSLLSVTGKLGYVCDRTKPDLLVATGETSAGAAEVKSTIRWQDRPTTS